MIITCLSLPSAPLLVPPDVTHMDIISYSETHLVLEWPKVNNNNEYSYVLQYWNGTEISISGSGAGRTVTHTVTSLSAGSRYSFTVFTVFEGLRSLGYPIPAITGRSHLKMLQGEKDSTVPCKNMHTP